MSSKTGVSGFLLEKYKTKIIVIKILAMAGSRAFS
jgi:hypothetical protein